MTRPVNILIFDASSVLPPNAHPLHIPQLRATLMRLNRPIYRLYIYTNDNAADLDQQLQDQQLRHFFHDLLTPKSFASLDLTANNIQTVYFISPDELPPHQADAPLQHLDSIDDLVLQLATA